MSEWSKRVCIGCHKDLAQAEFSSAQWAKGIGGSRCTLCVNEGIEVG